MFKKGWHLILVLLTRDLIQAQRSLYTKSGRCGIYQQTVTETTVCHGSDDHSQQLKSLFSNLAHKEQAMTRLGCEDIQQPMVITCHILPARTMMHFGVGVEVLQHGRVSLFWSWTRGMDSGTRTRQSVKDWMLRRSRRRIWLAGVIQCDTVATVAFTIFLGISTWMTIARLVAQQHNDGDGWSLQGLLLWCLIPCITTTSQIEQYQLPGKNDGCGGYR